MERLSAIYFYLTCHGTSCVEAEWNGRDYKGNKRKTGNMASVEYHRIRTVLRAALDGIGVWRVMVRGCDMAGDHCSGSAADTTFWA